MAIFNGGDLVALKSGNSPKMTVAFYSDSKTVVCQWFSNGELKDASFQETSLKIWEDEKHNLPEAENY